MKLLSLASTHHVLPCALLRTALHATPCMRVITRRCSAVLGVSIVTPSHASCRSCFLFFLKRKAAHLERRDLEEEDDGDGDSDCDCDGNGGCGCDTIENEDDNADEDEDEDEDDDSNGDGDGNRYDDKVTIIIITMIIIKIIIIITTMI
jgi:hypothetical protein